MNQKYILTAFENESSQLAKASGEISNKKLESKKFEE
jgi:hypothetical protein